MPQMAPYSWTLLMIFFMLVYIVMNSMIYFFNNKNNNFQILPMSSDIYKMFYNNKW